ncbi:MAG TPA: DUF1697 domain-containing protein [Solirubrobacteraceae bacterium]|nr:DUF1697 domain-containing protein [Solirubrobacteraceae bacterium]
MALLRGINVGKAKQLPMEALRALAEELGFADVATHLRSGNLVYATDEASQVAAARLEAAIPERFGLHSSVLVRTATQIAAVVAHDPLRAVSANDSRYHVVFLPEPPEADGAAELLALDLAPDALAIEGREVYYWCPNGMSDSRAVDALAAAKLARHGTDRNWNTVARLAQMLAG